jgi:hypothetical protein
MQTLLPRCVKAAAKFTAMVVLPTPPFKFVTAIFMGAKVMKTK